MKTNKKTYLIAALLLISLVSAIPIDPLPGSGQTQHTTSVPAQIPESTYPQLPLALFAAAAAALLIYQQAAKPRYITDGATYRIDSSGKLYLPTGGGWTEATFSSDAAYTQYLRTSVKSAAGDKVAVRGADGKWALASKSAVSSYLSMLDSSQSKLTQLQKDLPGARGRFFAAKRQSATSWMTRSAAAVYDKILGGIDAAKSTIGSLTSWLSDLTKFGSSDKYGFKFSGRTYTYGSSGLEAIKAQSAYSRFKEEATASESSFTSELKTLFSGYSSHAAALGWSGVDLMKQRMKEIYQTHLSEIGAASQEFSVDYVKNGDWKHAEKKRSELSSETKDDMKVLYEKYLEKLDELAYDKLVSAEEKARIAAEEARLKQEEAWRAQSFWDRNGDKIRAKLKKDYVSSLAAAGKLRDSALKAYTGSVTTTYYDAFEKVGFLESHDRSGSEFDRYYLGYRSEVGDQQLVARDAKSLNRAADIMDALNKALAQGDVYLSNDVRYLQSYLSDVEESAGSQAYGWFKESLYTPWATQFEESWKAGVEKEKERLRQEAESEAKAVASQIAAGRAATADMIQKMQARDLLLKQFQDFGWGQYNPNNPNGVCVASTENTSSLATVSITITPLFDENGRRESNLLDNIVGVVFGAGEGLNDLVTGLGSLLHGAGETAWNYLNNPVKTKLDLYSKVAYLVTHPKEVTTQVLDAIFMPVIKDWYGGRPGEAVGRLGFEIFAALFPADELKGASKVDDVSALAKAEKISAAAKAAETASIFDRFTGTFDDILKAIKNKLGFADETSILTKDELLKIGFKEEQIIKIESLGLNKAGIQRVIDAGGIEQLTYALRTYDNFVLKDMFEYSSTAVNKFRSSQAIRVTTRTDSAMLSKFGEPTNGFFAVDADVLRGLDLTKIEDVMKLEGRLGKLPGSLVNELKAGGELRIYTLPENAKYTLPQNGDADLGIPGSGVTVGGAQERFVEGSMDLTKLSYKPYVLN
jgi:hypothetical protein